MKRIALIAIALLTIAFIDSFAQMYNCDEGCTYGNWTTARKTYTIDDPPVSQPGSQCEVDIDYSYREINCNGNFYHEVRINWIAAFIDYTCPTLSFGDVMIQQALDNLFKDQTAFSWGFPPVGATWDNYLAVGPACWERVWGSGPAGNKYYLYKCADAPVCCKPYSVQHISGNPDVVRVAEGSYLPVSCQGIIGPLTHQACFTWCP